MVALDPLGVNGHDQGLLGSALRPAKVRTTPLSALSTRESGDYGGEGFERLGHRADQAVHAPRLGT